MKVLLTGKISCVGTRYGESPYISIQIGETVDEEVGSILEVDVEKSVAIEAAKHLYEDVRILIEVLSRPKIVE